VAVLPSSRQSGRRSPYPQASVRSLIEIIVPAARGGPPGGRCHQTLEVKPQDSVRSRPTRRIRGNDFRVLVSC